MKNFTHLGFNNWVRTENIDSVVDYDASPIVRYVQHARQNHTLVDATKGRRTKSVITLESGHVVISHMAPDTIVGRIEGIRSKEPD